MRTVAFPAALRYTVCSAQRFTAANGGDVSVSILTTEQIRKAVCPIAEKYAIPAVFLFGSYARGTAGDDSDVDLLVDTTGTEIKSLLDLGAVLCDLEDALGKRVDLITVCSMEQAAMLPSDETFRKRVREERVKLYAVA
ncbi:MAG: nucleotidyltransferase domain-containing protein [Oscillospiraceae bacterium]|nr:nucleotidyltransferase domain-containing protein [Oscillospiraceae bacterium]